MAPCAIDLLDTIDFDCADSSVLVAVANHVGRVAQCRWFEEVGVKVGPPKFNAGVLGTVADGDGRAVGPGLRQPPQDLLALIVGRALSQLLGSGLHLAPNRVGKRVCNLFQCRDTVHVPLVGVAIEEAGREKNGARLLKSQPHRPQRRRTWHQPVAAAGCIFEWKIVIDLEVSQVALNGTSAIAGLVGNLAHRQSTGIASK